jgi:thiol-disulfide isomerase/thioredoxin
MTSSEPTRRSLLRAAALLGTGAGLEWQLRRVWLPSPHGINVHVEPRALPALHLIDAQGNRKSLDAWHGRVVLLNVWATWCAPCREEMPALDRLQTALGGPAFEVIALSIDSGGMPAVQAFFRRTGVRQLQPYLDAEQDAARSLAAGGIPLSLLIDAQGREVARKLGAAHWDDPEVQRLIRQYLPPSPP